MTYWEHFDNLIEQLTALHSTDTQTMTPFKLCLDVTRDIDYSNWSQVILDPCCGKGSFLLSVIKGFINAGCPAEHIVNNIIHGFDIDEGQVEDTIIAIENVTGINSNNIHTKDFLNEETPMKIQPSYIVMNPPYQDNHVSKKLWNKFILKAFDLLDDNGTLLCVAPRAWVERPQSQLSRKMVDTIFSKHQVDWIDITAEQHFKVGESPCSFSVTKRPKTDLTKLINHNETTYIDYTGQKIPLTELDKLKIAIFQKFADHPAQRLIRRVHCDTGVIDSMELLLQKGIMSEGKKSDTDKKCYWTAANQDTFYMPEDKCRKGIKVILNRSGYYYQDKNPNKYICIDTDETYGVGAGAFGVLCETLEEAKNLKSLLTTKLYRWYIEHEKTSGFNTGLPKLPLLSLDKHWNDNDVYDALDIDQEHRAVINESTFV